MEITLGIDLGTTNSVCCSLVNGKFDFLKFRGRDLLPSAILWKDGKLTVGDKARKKSIIYSSHFIKSSKVFMGDMEKKWRLDDRDFSPTDVAFDILKHLRENAEKYYRTDRKFTSVITVPAYFTSNQINETKKAGENAGLIVKQIITEPVAAAVAYGFENRENQKLFVVDIGGGTFDVSILEIQENVYNTIAIDGDSKLGGDNFDEVVLEMFFKRIRQTAGIDLSTHEKSELPKGEFLQVRQRLIMEAENAKIELAETEAVEIEIPNLFKYKEKPYNFSLKVSRKEFEEEARPLFNRMNRIIQDCVNKARLVPSDIDKVILVGGTSYMPIIQDYMKDLFGKKPFSDMDLSKLVAMGAALIADDERDGIQVRDIISHSLGIELIGEKFARILHKNEHYPVSNSDRFTTTLDFQEKINIRVFEGEDKDFVKNNEFYGGFVLSDIEIAKAGVPKIEVTFHFDKSRDLHVTARDLLTGSEEFKTITIDKNKTPV